MEIIHFQVAEASAARRIRVEGLRRLIGFPGSVPQTHPSSKFSFVRRLLHLYAFFRISPEIGDTQIRVGHTSVASVTQYRLFLCFLAAFCAAGNSSNVEDIGKEIAPRRSVTGRHNREVMNEG